MLRLKKLVERMDRTLMEYQEMYEEITKEFYLWEQCLEIIHNCNHDDEGTIQRLWRSIIFRLIPCEGDNVELQRCIKQWRDESDIEFHYADPWCERSGLLYLHITLPPTESSIFVAKT